jgi:hypothetical protein
MDLRSIKKEAWNLPCVNQDLEKLQDNWLKPLNRNNKYYLECLNYLSNESKLNLSQKLVQINESFNELGNASFVNDKLRSHARSLIDLKLTTIRPDDNKVERITNSLLNDDFMSIKNTLTEVKAFSDNVGKLSNQYEDLNHLLSKELSLEESLFFMELPHKKYLFSLQQTSKKQKKIVRHIGRHFVSLVKENKHLNKLRRKKND